MACSKCKKKNKEKDNFVTKTDRLSQIAFGSLVVLVILAIYGLYSLITTIL
jgi:hypothetical protein